MNEQGTDTFKDSTVLTKLIKGFLYAWIVIAAIPLLFEILEYQSFGDFREAVVGSIGVRLFITKPMQFVVFIVTAILVLKWIYRANFNARQLGASGMKFTPGWSVGWYFIPIANFWKPYQAMKEIWKASENPINWQDQSVPSILPWWWFFWIVSGFPCRACEWLSLLADELNELIVANIVLLFSDVVDILLILIFLVIVGRVYEMQMSHHRKTSNKSLQPTSLSLGG